MMFPPTLDQILSPIEATPHTVEEVYLNGVVDGGDSGDPLDMMYVYHRHAEVIALREAYKTRHGLTYYRANTISSRWVKRRQWQPDLICRSSAVLKVPVKVNPMRLKNYVLTVLLRGDAIVSVEK